jgi:amino acid permease
MKYIGLLISTACIFVGPILIYGIIWYEKYGSNNRRTFLNMIVSMYCLSALVFIFFVQVPETLRGIIGPLPTYVCSSQVNTKICF